MSQRYDTTRAVPRRQTRPRPDERPYLIGISGEHAGRLFPLTGRRVVMIGRTEERFALNPKHVAGDVACGTGEMLGWLVKRKIDPFIPIWDKRKREDFTYEKERDIYLCPAGKTLKTTG